MKDQYCESKSTSLLVEHSVIVEICTMFVCSIPCSLLKMPSELLIAPSGGIQLCSIISDKFYAQIGQAVLALGGQPRKARTTSLAVWRLSECSTMNQGYVSCVCVCCVSLVYPKRVNGPSPLTFNGDLHHKSWLANQL